MPREKSPSATELLQQVCDIMEERDLTEVLLREDGLTLKVRRGSEPVPVALSQPSDMVPLPSAEQVESPAAQLSPEVGETRTVTDGGVVLRVTIAGGCALCGS